MAKSKHTRRKDNDREFNDGAHMDSKKIKLPKKLRSFDSYDPDSLTAFEKFSHKR